MRCDLLKEFLAVSLWYVCYFSMLLLHCDAFGVQELPFTYRNEVQCYLS